MKTVRVNGSDLQVVVQGKGPAVLMLPGLGRDERDFERIANILISAGFQILIIRPSRYEGSEELTDGRSLIDFADDAFAVLDALAPGQKVAIVGATFGNRVARVMAAQNPSRIEAIALLGAGGTVPPDDDAIVAARSVMTALAMGHQTDRADAAVYFSPETDLQDIELWRRFVDGWHPRALAAQRTAARGFVDGPLPDQLQALIVQGSDDRIAPPANGMNLATAWGTRAELVQLDGCGHMMLLEKPDVIAEVLLNWLLRISGDI